MERPTTFEFVINLKTARALGLTLLERSRPMSHYTFEQFFADTRATIESKGVPSGLAEIRDHLEKLLHTPPSC